MRQNLSLTAVLLLGLIGSASIVRGQTPAKRADSAPNPSGLADRSWSPGTTPSAKDMPNLPAPGTPASFPEVPATDVPPPNLLPIAPTSAAPQRLTHPPAEASAPVIRGMPLAPAGPQAPSLFLEKNGPVAVPAGKSFTYTIVVRNTGSVPVAKVTVEDQLPPGAGFVKSDPQAQVRGERLVWTLGDMDIGAQQRIKVEIQPPAEGEILSTATVTFSASSTLRTQIIRPKLILSVTAPKSALVGDAVEFQIHVANAGSGPATNVIIHDNLPSGLWHNQGGHIDADLGTIAPGETRVVPLQTTAVKIGKQVNQLFVSGDIGIRASNETAVDVTEPLLTLRTIGPKRRYLNREAQFDIELANGGTAPASGIRVVNYLPEGLEFVSASDGGTHDPATRSVSWKLDNVTPEQKKMLSVKVMARAAGDLVTKTTAQPSRGRELRSETAVHVEGMAALACEVVDLDNPIEVGAETTYEIRIFNHGTAPSSGLQIRAIFPAGMKPSNGAGPTAFHIQDNQVIFDKLDKLAPRADTVYRIKVVGMQAGDMRVKVQLTSDHLRTPIVQEEVTRVYNDRDEAAPADTHSVPHPTGRTSQKPH